MWHLCVLLLIFTLHLSLSLSVFLMLSFTFAHSTRSIFKCDKSVVGTFNFDFTTCVLPNIAYSILFSIPFSQKAFFVFRSVFFYASHFLSTSSTVFIYFCLLNRDSVVFLNILLFIYLFIMKMIVVTQRFSMFRRIFEWTRFWEIVLFIAYSCCLFFRIKHKKKKQSSKWEQKTTNIMRFKLSIPFDYDEEEKKRVISINKMKFVSILVKINVVKIELFKVLNGDIIWFLFVQIQSDSINWYIFRSNGNWTLSSTFWFFKRKIISEKHTPLRNEIDSLRFSSHPFEFSVSVSVQLNVLECCL